MLLADLLWEVEVRLVSVNQMDEWVRPALRVQFRTASSVKSHSLIGNDCLVFLLVHIGCHRRMLSQAMANQFSSDAHLLMHRIDEKCFHMPPVDKHECQRVIVAVNCKRKRR